MDLPDELLAIVLGRVSRALPRQRWHPADVCRHWASLLLSFEEVFTVPREAKTGADSLRTSLASFANLKVLRFCTYSLAILDDGVFGAISSTCPLLESLTMARSASPTCDVTTQGLDSLFRGCKNLKDLWIPCEFPDETEIPASIFMLTSLTLFSLEDMNGMSDSEYELEFSRGLRGEVHLIRVLQPPYGIWTKLASINSVKKLVVDGILIAKPPQDLGGLQLSVKQLRWKDVAGVVPHVVTQFQCLQHAAFESIDTLPDGLGNLPALRTLSIRNVSLTEDSIRQLTGLRVLRLFPTLPDLPDAIGDLQALEVIYIEAIEKRHLSNIPGGETGMSWRTMMRRHLFSLPDSIGNLSSLRKLHLTAFIGLLPESLGHLPSLRDLYIDACGEKRYLPDSFSMLTGLTTLRLKELGIEDLPVPFGANVRMEVLEIDNCPWIQVLPDTLGQTSSLRSLILKDLPRLQSMPSLSGLQRLDYLEVVSCPAMKIIEEGFGLHPELQALHLRFCGGPKSLPQSFGGLEALVKLQLTDCTNLRSLPRSTSRLLALEEMTLSGCSKLQKLPESMGRLLRLTSIEIEMCDELRSLPSSLSSLQNLKSLKLQHCQQLQGLPNSFGAHGPMQLSEIVLVDLASLEDLPHTVGELPALESLVVLQCPRMKKLLDHPMFQRLRVRPICKVIYDSE